MSERETASQQASGDEPAGARSGRRPDEGAPPPPMVGGESITEQPPGAGEPIDWAERGFHASLPIGSAQPSGISTLPGEPEVIGGGSVAAGKGKVRRGDRIFASITTGAGLFIVLLILLVAVFLVVQAIPAIRDDKSNFLFSRDWNVEAGNLQFGILGLLWTTVLISFVAMIIAVPLALGISLFITQYAPRRLARPVAYIVDLLAAIPSIIYGIWGIVVLAPYLEPVQRFLYHIGGFALFKDENINRGTVFNAGVVIAIMVLPIVTAVARDVFERTPTANIEAAWALGATKWEMIKMAVIPHGRPGFISGAMLGLGRALGETIAITLILSKGFPG